MLNKEVFAQNTKRIIIMRTQIKLNEDINNNNDDIKIQCLNYYIPVKRRLIV